MIFNDTSWSHRSHETVAVVLSGVYIYIYKVEQWSISDRQSRIAIVRVRERVCL